MNEPMFKGMEEADIREFVREMKDKGDKEVEEAIEHMRDQDFSKEEKKEAEMQMNNPNAETVDISSAAGSQELDVSNNMEQVDSEFKLLCEKMGLVDPRFALINPESFSASLVIVSAKLGRDLTPQNC